MKKKILEGLMYDCELKHLKHDGTILLPSKDLKDTECDCLERCHKSHKYRITIEKLSPGYKGKQLIRPKPEHGKTLTEGK